MELFLATGGAGYCFCKAPREIFYCKGRYINNTKLN